MELARLASKQAATSPAGPFPGPEQPKPKKKLPRYPGQFPATFFFLSDPHVVGNSDLPGVLPVLGRGHLDKFRARAENRKTQFPGARGTFGGDLRPPQKFLPEIAQLFYILRFGRPDPNGREIAKCWPFWPRAAHGTWRNSGPKTENRNFPELGGLLGANPSAPKVSPQNWPTGPPRAGNRKILGV